MSVNKRIIRFLIVPTIFIGVFLSILLLLGEDSTNAWFKSESQSSVSNFSAASVFPDLIISDVRAAPKCSSASITWTTNKPSSTIVEWSWTSGGPYSIHSDPVLVTSHGYEITGIAPGTIWYYRVTSVSGDGTAVSSDESDFTSVSAGRPSLNLWKDSSYWNSYEEYLGNILTVGFRLENAGPDAFDPFIAGIRNTNGVITYSISTINDIPTGSFSPFTVKYMIPAGVIQFNTQIFMDVSDACGNTYSYPGPFSGT